MKFFRNDLRIDNKPRVNRRSEGLQEVLYPTHGVGSLRSIISDTESSPVGIFVWHEEKLKRPLRCFSWRQGDELRILHQSPVGHQSGARQQQSSFMLPIPEIFYACWVPETISLLY